VFSFYVFILSFIFVYDFIISINNYRCSQWGGTTPQLQCHHDDTFRVVVALLDNATDSLNHWLRFKLFSDHRCGDMNSGIGHSVLLKDVPGMCIYELVCGLKDDIE